MNMDLEKDLYLKIEEIIEKYENNKNNILGILLEVQAIAPQQYISADIAKFVSRSLGISLSRTYDVITFYSALSDKPRGQYVIQICNSTACMVNKYETLKDVLEQQLEIKVGETTNDGVFTLMYSPCFGACDVSPAFRIGDEIFGELSKKKIKDIIHDYRRENLKEVL
ncbi:NAD(P)H-dependent oxidoreductase subunit E [Clostridium intestinale]|uniref:NADH-quinone oxidoreductase subunit NuoE family protein n=1 Tax=Clostridium intestinale TaxID=36845 RepID=UPI002DD632AC|nr:NAD(P)H-dependent oxidoreductase subunit E [Clostridium intestinale]WRY51351.1 NAD(P)H-dependent oxidoreductase subunit E [Clostridium intestinale]